MTAVGAVLVAGGLGERKRGVEVRWIGLTLAQHGALGDERVR